MIERVGCQVGFPKAIRVDKSSEFVSRDLDLSFNGKFRSECLNAHWFISLDEAQRKCEA